jgi:hypothetical protein
MTISKIEKVDGNFIIFCDRTDTYRNAKDCGKCKGLISIDPVKAQIKCRGCM